jgi:hypothetical protein
MYCRALFASSLLLSCGGPTCEESVATAEQQARLDAADCTWAPDLLAEPDCSRTNIKPLLGYQATWCNTAELACIQQDTDATGVCFGNP